jgi:hypothetical protein
MTLDPKTTERFYAKVDRRGPDDCWPWQGATHNKNGYGSFRFDGRARVASRYALMIKLGRRLLPGEKALHECDNPPCSNPAHLFSGTTADNAQDAVRKGRWWHQKMTHCKSGHLLTEDSTYRTSRGGRLCKQCQSRRSKEYRARLAKAVAD